MNNFFVLFLLMASCGCSAQEIQRVTDPELDISKGQVEIFVRDAEIIRFHSDKDPLEIKKDYVSYIKYKGQRNYKAAAKIIADSELHEVSMSKQPKYIYAPLALILLSDGDGKESSYYLDECVLIDQKSGKAYVSESGILDWLRDISSPMQGVRDKDACGLKF